MVKKTTERGRLGEQPGQDGVVLVETEAALDEEMARLGEARVGQDRLGPMVRQGVDG